MYQNHHRERPRSWNRSLFLLRRPSGIYRLESLHVLTIDKRISADNNSLEPSFADELGYSLARRAPDFSGLRY